MLETDTSISLVLSIVLFTSFIKIATVLSICRYGLGLVGFEFGAVCLLVSLALAVFTGSPELKAAGFPEALFTKNRATQVSAESLRPFMERRVDADIARQFNVTPSSDSTGGGSSVKSLGVAFVLSELKNAFQLGCVLLVPLVIIDLLGAHLLALLGVQHLSAHVVTLPLKIMTFIAAGGWGALGKKLLGAE
jgi:flagellar biosynthesis protein FliP